MNINHIITSWFTVHLLCNTNVTFTLFWATHLYGHIDKDDIFDIYLSLTISICHKFGMSCNEHWLTKMCSTQRLSIKDLEPVTKCWGSWVGRPFFAVNKKINDFINNIILIVYTRQFSGGLHGSLPPPGLALHSWSYVSWLIATGSDLASFLLVLNRCEYEKVVAVLQGSEVVLLGMGVLLLRMKVEVVLLDMDMVLLGMEVVLLGMDMVLGKWRWCFLGL